MLFIVTIIFLIWNYRSLKVLQWCLFALHQFRLEHCSSVATQNSWWVVPAVSQKRAHLSKYTPMGPLCGMIIMAHCIKALDNYFVGDNKCRGSVEHSRLATLLQQQEQTFHVQSRPKFTLWKVSLLSLFLPPSLPPSRSLFLSLSLSLFSLSLILFLFL